MDLLDWLNFAVKISEPLAWPAVVAGALFGFRSVLTELIEAAAQKIKDIETLKWGDAEFATARAAVQATEARADDVERKLAEADLPPDERQDLARQLREVSAEAERLRALIEIHMRQRSADLTPPVRSVSMTSLVEQSSLIRRLVAELGAERVSIEPQRGRDFQMLFETINYQIGNLTQREKAVLADAGVVGSTGHLTMEGLKILRQAALDSKAE